MNLKQAQGAAPARYRLAFGILLGAMLLSACGAANAPEPSRSIPVSVTFAETGTVVQYGEYAARVRSAGAVEVRAQVGGVLKKRLYSEGAQVEQDQVLFEIDTEPFELALRRTEAELAEVQAQRDDAEREWRRQRDLFSRKVSSENDKDKAETALQATSARLEKSKAAVGDAKRKLRYARVSAPVSGVAGLEIMAKGNLVEAGTLLTTITPLDPVHVYFTLPARAASLRRAMIADGAWEPKEVALLLNEGQRTERHGQLDFSDERIDPRTDSIQMRAVFPNSDGTLLPGQFVRIQLALREFRNVVLIDPKAVTEGPAGPQVFTIDLGDSSDQQTASVRIVELGPIVDGRQVVLAGLSAGDRVVVNGQVSLRSGSAVSVVEAIPEALTHSERITRTRAKAVR